jgi:hypothetical protein
MKVNSLLADLLGNNFKMKTAIYIIIFLIIPYNLSAGNQDSIAHIRFLKSIEINTGMGRLLINDQIGSPMNYQGLFCPIKLNYTFRGQ